MKPDFSELEQAVSGASPEEIPGLLGGLAQLQAVLWLRLRAQPAQNENAGDKLKPDSLITIEAAAEQLSTSKKWIYNRRRTLPFIVVLGPRKLRCSTKKLQVFMEKRTGIGRCT